MTQIIQFLGTWFGAFMLGLWIPGLVYYGDKYKVLDFKKEWLLVIRDILGALLWPVPFILDMIKRMNGAVALILLPAVTMAADNKFLDYQLFPALGVLIALVPLLMLRAVIQRAKGKLKPWVWYDDYGNRHEDNKKRPITEFWAFYFYIVVQLICIGFCIAILMHHR